jgi:uncharacterized protein (DUF2235 family)
MNNIAKNTQVGDTKSPAFKPNSDDLRYAVDSSFMVPAESAPTVRIVSPAATAAYAVKAKSADPLNCEQKLWLSFFFDGTGNNLEADVGTFKHSNVAKLYRAHQPNNRVSGTYRIYVPGVGTYFRDVGDAGGTLKGSVAGDKGDLRLVWALEQFDGYISLHRDRAAASPQNRILEINIAIYGFSRGAALARAFSNDFLKSRAQLDSAGNWHLKKTSIPVHIRFMGLFDTVASVGVPMSNNNSSALGVLSGVEKSLRDRLNRSSFRSSRPNVLAYSELGQPGADPSPGKSDGHSEWGGRLAIPHMVEDVRHFIAAHEIRNSFPVESISIIEKEKISKPSHFHEYVFPGVHSDVGGSYRAGEGGISLQAPDKLGLVTLHQMYIHSLKKKVPFLPITNSNSIQGSDFAISANVLKVYNYYQSKIVASLNVGEIINSHMACYYAWRFRGIHKKLGGYRGNVEKISEYNIEFQHERKKLMKEISGLEIKFQVADGTMTAARENRDQQILYRYGASMKEVNKLEEELSSSSARRDDALDELLRAKARLEALPEMSKLNSLTSFYEKRLMDDVKLIKNGRTNSAGILVPYKHGDLRPHYKIIIEAYENEFIHDKGLKDETIISFFDNYVHDSLSGFAKDATLPSDPRVVYLGGDEKYKYAQLKSDTSDSGQQYA